MGELILRYGSQWGIGIAELGPNCRNEIAIGFVEIGLTLKRGKRLRLPRPRSRLRSPGGFAPDPISRFQQNPESGFLKVLYFPFSRLPRSNYGTKNIHT